MYIQSKKILTWNAKDFVRTVILFIMNMFLVAALIIATIYFNVMSFSKFSEFFGEKENVYGLLFAACVLFLTFLIIFLFFYFEARNFIKEPKNLQMVFLIIELCLVISYVIGRVGTVYARPIALCALLSLLLIDRKTSIFMNTIMCFIVFIMDYFTNFTIYANGAEAFAALMIGFSAGLAGIYLVSGVKSRIKVFFMGFIISLLVIFPMFMFVGNYSLKGLLVCALTGLSAGVLSVVLFMTFLPLFEFGFNILTDYRLSEITDHNFKPIRRLIEFAPGTFNHSLIVSNLAEACATAIGENSQVARAAAYYHDLGKLKQPGFFAENQSGYSMHEELTPEVSTDIIRSHAKDGAEFIKKYHLPQLLSDIALQHHGTMPIIYFYHKASKLTDGELNIEDFSYYGPKPQTRMAAIIMLADSSEAKVRTMTDRSRDNVDKAVKEIIDERMRYEQFDECEITLLDINIIRHTLVNSLAGVYHDRIVYPKIRRIK